MSADHTIRYTTDGETVTDAQTGLVWDLDTLPKMTHEDALARADRANDEHYKGHADWRVPTVQELISMVDFTRSSPACDPVFRARKDSYWSSTDHVPDPADAWVVDFSYGDTGADGKTDYNFVRLVRSGQ